METSILAKDLTINNLVEKVNSLTDKVTQLESLIANQKSNSGTLDVEKQQGSSTIPNWVTVASRAVARVEEKNVTRPTHQIEVINSVTNEQVERERRKKNVVVFGVPVSGNKTQEKQENDDKGFIERTFRALKIDVKKIKFIRRFRSNPTNNRPPPILIQLSSENDRQIVLSAAKDLRKLSEYKDVFINPDLTEAQRILNKQLREDRKKLNQKEIENSSNIRYGIGRNGFRKYTVQESSESISDQMQV